MRKLQNLSMPKLASGPDLLGNHIEVLFRELIKFQMATDAVTLLKATQEIRHTPPGMVKRLSEKGIGDMIWPIKTACGVDQNTFRIERTAKLPQDVLLFI